MQSPRHSSRSNSVLRSIIRQLRSDKRTLTADLKFYKKELEYCIKKNAHANTLFSS